MNRKKIGFLSIVFSCFLGICAIMGDALATVPAQYAEGNQWCPPEKERSPESGNYLTTFTCETCTHGFYTGPDGVTQFCCSKDHFVDYNYSHHTYGLGTVNAECQNGQFVCKNSYLVRAVSASMVNSDLTIKTDNGYVYSNWTCALPDMMNGSAYIAPIASDGYTFAGCGTVGSDSGNNSFKNCKLYKDLTGKTGCTYGGTNGKVREWRQWKNRHYGPTSASDGAGLFDTVTQKFYTNSSSDVVIANMTKTYEFNAQPGYKKNTSSGTCSACSAGTYSAGGSNTSCSSCTPGKYQDTTGQTSCKSCSGSNEFQPNSGASYCLIAPTNSTVNSAHTDISCNANYYRWGSAYACLACPFYRYSTYGTDVMTLLAESDIQGTSSAGSTGITQCYGYPQDSDSTGTYLGRKCNAGDWRLYVVINTTYRYGSSQYCYDALSSVLMELLIGSSSDLNWFTYDSSGSPASMFQVYGSGDYAYFEFPWSVGQALMANSTGNNILQACSTEMQFNDY